MLPPNKFFLSARLNVEEIELTVESYICLFVYAYCEIYENICFIDDVEGYVCRLPLTAVKNVKHSFITREKVKVQELYLSLPAISVEAEKTFIAGICAVLRWSIKAQVSKIPDHYSESLLGFRGGCLVACTESSVWTNFCELQVPRSVSELKSNRIKSDYKNSTEIPSSLVLLEAHLNRPVRTHNILKRKLDIAKKIKQENLDKTLNSPDTNISHPSFESDSIPVTNESICRTLENLVITEKTEEFCLKHIYLEGIDLTLADMIVFPCIHYLLKNLPSKAENYLENVMKWYKRMSLNQHVKNAMAICGLDLQRDRELAEKEEHNVIVPVVDIDSLYKRDPSHSKLRIKHRSPSEILKVFQMASVCPCYDESFCTTLDWNALPSDLHPAKGDLPKKRIDRKCQQIESMVTAVLKVATEGQTIVEFCAGGGHVGLLLAYFLPKCKIILIENKESSIERAMCRVGALNLSNVTFCQCNLDYFRGSFDLGVALHACGVATDLVLQQCMKQNASFVCCPCCYGGIQNTHLLTYPLSMKLKGLPLTYEKYTLLAHCADRTEVNTPTAQEGELCMGLIDTDRLLFAKEQGYNVKLTTLQPLSCSPKHNLLIGTKCIDAVN